MTLHILADLEQGTEEWLAARRGIVTASVVGKLLTFEAPNAMTVDCPKCKGLAGANCISLARKTPTPISTFHPERTAIAASLPHELAIADNETSRAITATLAAERITGWTEETRMTDDMFRGVLSEPIARDLYGQHYEPVTEVGFMRLDEDGWTLGYSPDGLVGDDGLVEFKAPRAKTHLSTVLSDQVPTHYMAQAQAGLLVSGRKWLDFVPYVGGLPLWRKRVHPDPAWFAAIEAACRRFEENAAQIVAAYKTATEGLPATERISQDIEIKVA